ncbi:ABC transporter ATP-binding protein [Paenibacillus cremeus]|uniref:Carnitine transport ATP-binding protein OpuCA n=1 Tax=Paenibacillus cremeus TaxID=2163881 RepID=A0A559K7M4_9BACL|nr:ABC transporter ATP-binding protein [Paenibacillus cremeus]TVY08129.1 ABC transporter ATP-binding protein [Paenibacillus cremeus]
MKGNTNPNPTAITIKSLRKSFGSNPILKDVSFDIRPGEFFTLLGSSGCGKTTLLRCIAGFEKADSGSIYFGDQDVMPLNPWEKNIGFVFQNYALWPHMTIFDNIAYGLKMRKADKQTIREKVAWALDLINLSGTETRTPGELSGGQQQRISIARALVLSPQVLLLDEPLSNLDAKLRIKMRADIKEIQKRLGITSIYVTHDQEEALELSDRIAVMEKGNVMQVGTPEEIYETPANAFTANFVGRSNQIKGTVRGGVFVTEGGTTIPLRGVHRKDGRALLCFRPENVMLRGSGEPSGEAFRVKVTESSYRGNFVQGTVALNDDIQFHADWRERFIPGSELSVEISKYLFYDIE